MRKPGASFINSLSNCSLSRSWCRNGIPSCLTECHDCRGGAGCPKLVLPRFASDKQQGTWKLTRRAERSEATRNPGVELGNGNHQLHFVRHRGRVCYESRSGPQG